MAYLRERTFEILFLPYWKKKIIPCLILVAGYRRKLTGTNHRYTLNLLIIVFRGTELKFSGTKHKQKHNSLKNNDAECFSVTNCMTEKANSCAFFLVGEKHGGIVLKENFRRKKEFTGKDVHLSCFWLG